MLKKLVFLSSLVIALLFSTSCTNLLSQRNKEGSSITITLPYGNSSASRTADSEKEVYNFTVTFKHETAPAVEMKAKSGNSITYNDAPVGKYAITVKGFTDSGKKAEGFAEALVEEGKAANVSVILKVVEDGLIEINILSFTDELANMVKYYIKEHPDCGLVINHREVATTLGEYTPYLNKMLDGTSSEFVPDLYTAEAAFVLHYTQGSMGRYALPYKELIPDVDEKIKAAEYAQYVVDIGKNTSGDVVGLAYQSTGGAFIYNRTVAKDVFGTDDPAEIEKEIGAKSGSWNKFWEAAEACKEKGVAIISGDGDLWHPVSYTAEEGWVVDGKLHIDANRKAFLDYSKDLTDKGYSNNTQDWTDEWYLDMDEKGAKPVLGFFGPAWLLNYTFAEKSVETKGDWAVCAPPVGFSWGGSWIEVNKAVNNASSEKQKAIAKLIEWLTLDTTEDGLLYNWANGKVTGNTKDTVSSAVVMKKSDGRLDFLGGQDMFECYIPMNEQVNAINLTEYDDDIDRLWREQVRLYADGIVTKETALSNFIYGVQVKLGLSYDGELETSYYQSEHVRAEPDPDGKGVKFTITALEGENWDGDTITIRERNSGLFLRLGDAHPEPENDNNTVVCYWPFTENGKGYIFDCDFKFTEDWNNIVTETVYSLANGGGASVIVDYDSLEGFAPVLNLENGKVTLNKDISAYVSYSKNVTLSWDFGAFTNSKNEPDSYEWKQWLSSAFVDFKDSKLFGDGVPLLQYSVDNVKKIRKDGYCFVNLELKIEVEGIRNKYTYSSSVLSDIYDPKELISNLSENQHISVTACEQGIKVTLKYLEGDGKWNDWTRVSCLTSDGKAGVSFETLPKRTLTSETDVDIGNGKPTATSPLVDYIYPFTEAGKQYEFELSCDFTDSDGNGKWFTEYVTCKAGSGGVGELIDADEWCNNVSVSDYNFTNKTFKVNGNIEGLLKGNPGDSNRHFTQAQLLIDVYPGTEKNHRPEKFAYTSRPVNLAGTSYDWMRDISELKNALRIEREPDPNNENYLDDVDAVLAEYGNQFWVTISLHYIQIQEVPEMEYILPWK